MTPRSLLEPARLAGTPLLRSQTDERLVDLTRAGNTRAFEAIVHRYRRPLLRYCSRLLPAEQAEDTVQHAFVRAYDAIRKGDAALNLRPWLYRITHNAAIDALRRGGAAHEPLDEQIDGVERPDQAVERSERLGAVLTAVQGLPERQRSAVVLRELEGRSYEEIATELGVTGGAVRQLLNRARTTLRTAATAVTPVPLAARIASTGEGETVAARIAEATAGAGTAATLAKVGAAVLVTGAVAGGVSDGPVPLVDERGGKDREARAAMEPASSDADDLAAGESAEHGDHPGETRSGTRVRDDGARRGDRDPDDDDDRERSGSGDGDVDNSGPGSGDGDVDNSGPGGGGGGDVDNSGPGSGSSGSGSSGSGSSGSGSSGSGSSGSGSSGSGSGDSGSGDSGSSGSGSSGSGSSGSGSSGSGG